MNIRKITEDILYTGVNDRICDRFEGLWPLPYGVSYNSYLVKGSGSTALIDTVKIDEVRPFFNNLGAAEINYLIVNHMEPDHSGSIPEVLKVYPNIKIICTQQAVPMLKGFCHLEDESKFIVVKDGDEISLGDISLRFYPIPMVHWPETMATYVPERNVLFSGDAFGTFGALNGAVVDKDMDTSMYFEEMYRYYSNIVGKYGRFVTAALNKLKPLQINYICPTHGPVWHEKIEKVMEITQRLASYGSERGVVIIYGTMYGNTAEAAEHIATNIAALGEKKIIVHNAARTPMSIMISDAFRYDTLIVGSCTYSMRLFPNVESFLNAMETREIRDKVFGVFGSFTWAPGAAESRFTEFAERLKLPLRASFSFRHAMSEASIGDAKTFAQKIMDVRK